MIFIMKRIVMVLIVTMMVGCAAWNLGTVERLAATAIAQEVGIAFAKEDRELADASVLYLEVARNLAQTNAGYRDAVEAGVSKLMDLLDDDRKDRLKPLMEQLLNELAIEYDLSGNITIPEEIDAKMLEALINGFIAGVEYNTGA